MWHSLEKEVSPGQWMSCENIILLETKLSQKANCSKWMQDLKESNSFTAAWNGECQGGEQRDEGWLFRVQILIR